MFGQGNQLHFVTVLHQPAPMSSSMPCHPPPPLATCDMQVTQRFQNAYTVRDIARAVDKATLSTLRSNFIQVNVH
jgi:hypothetical protein